MHFSQDYGYGMVDAYNAVRMAEAWRLFAPAADLRQRGERDDFGGRRSADRRPLRPLEFQFTVDDSGPDDRARRADAHADAQRLHSISTSILISPDGTEMMLLTRPPGGRRRQTTRCTWTFGIDGAARRARRRASGRCASRTLWRRIRHARIRSQFTAYGSEASVDSVYHYTDEFADMVALDASRATLSDAEAASTGSTWRPWRAASRSILPQARPPAPGSSSRPAR